MPRGTPEGDEDLIRKIAILGATVAMLAGCVQETQNRPPPGGGYPGGGAWLRDARDACFDRADRQGLRVIRSTREDLVTGSGGRVIGARIDMRVERGGQRFDVICDWTASNNRAVIRDFGGGGGGGRPPPDDGLWLRDAREACSDRARREDLRVVRTTREDLLRDGRGRVTGARIDMDVQRDGRRFGVVCDWNASNNRAVIRDWGGGGGRPPGPGTGTGQSWDAIQLGARSACDREAQRRGQRIRSVREAEPIGPQGAYTGARLRVLMSDRSEAVCTYDARRQTARLEGWGGGGGPVPGPGPSEAQVRQQARDACAREAARLGWGFRQTVSNEVVYGPGRRITGARLVVVINEGAGRVRQAACDFDLASGRARIARG